MGLPPDIPRSLAARDAHPAKPELARPLAISSLPLAPPADKVRAFARVRKKGILKCRLLEAARAFALLAALSLTWLLTTR